MFVTIFFVDWPNIEAAEKIDEQYKKQILELKPDWKYKDDDLNIIKTQCERMRTHMLYLIVVHFLCFLVTMYREILDAKTGTIGSIMRAVEVSLMMIYIAAIIQSLDNWTTWNSLYDNFQEIASALDIMNPMLESAFKIHKPDAFTDKNVFREWTGRCMHWFITETLVFTSYQSTMVILLIKSRFFNVGVENAH